MSLPEATASIRVIRPIVAALGVAGVPAGPILEELGSSPNVMDDPDARVPHELAVRFCLAALQATGDASFGLHAAETLRPGAFDVADYAARASRNLREGLQCLIRFLKLNHDVACFTVEDEGDRASITHSLPGGRVLPRPPAEYLMGSVVVLGRQMTGVAWNPLEVHFGHAQPEDMSEYRRLFGDAALKFDAVRLGIVVPIQTWELPLVEANPGLCAVLIRHAEGLLAKQPLVADTLSDQVRALLLKELQGGNPGVEPLSDTLLGMSVSTLHRRLKEEGTSHRQLLDTLRAELAERYLGEKGVSVTEVAFLLGFSEASAFHRAFKRWKGLTPAAFRQLGCAVA